MATVRPVPAAPPPDGERLGEWPLRADPRSARLARRLVSQALDGAHEQVRRRAVLVTSELVANAVRHARGGLLLQVQRTRGGWLLLVVDNSPAPPSTRAPGPLAEDGRGLLIVQRVCERVGWARTPTGKVVWAALDDDPAQA